MGRLKTALSAEFRNNRKAYLIAAAFLLGFFLFCQIPLPKAEGLSNPYQYHIAHLDRGDDALYYSFLRSAIVDGDLQYSNERPLQWRKRFRLNAAGRNFFGEYNQIGQDILSYPVFLGFHWFKRLLNIGPADGFSRGYIASYFITCSLFTLGGMLVIFYTTRLFVKPVYALTAVLTYFFTTAMPWTTYIRPFNHGADFLLCSLLMLSWFLLRSNISVIKYHLFFGLISGLAFVTRFDTAYILIAPFLDFLAILIRTYFRSKSEFFIALRNLSLSAAMFVSVVALQSLSWYYFNGKVYPQLLINKYLLSSGTARSLLAKKVDALGLFFGTGKWRQGILSFHPVYFLGLAGLAAMLRRKDTRSFALFMTVASLAYLYIMNNRYNANLLHGSSFGIRHMIKLNPVFIIATGVLFSNITSRHKWKIIAAALLILVFLNISFLAMFRSIVQNRTPDIEYYRNIKTLWLGRPGLLLFGTSLFSRLILAPKTLFGYPLIIWMGIGAMSLALTAAAIRIAEGPLIRRSWFPAFLAIVFILVLLPGYRLTEINMNAPSSEAAWGTAADDLIRECGRRIELSRLGDAREIKEWQETIERYIKDGRIGRDRKERLRALLTRITMYQS